MEKRVFKSVSSKEIQGVSWHGSLIRASLYELLKVFRLKPSEVIKHSKFDKTRYEICLKTTDFPAFVLYDRCVFPFGHVVEHEFDVVIDWHLGTFNEYVDVSTCALLRYVGLVVNDTAYDKSHHQLYVFDDLPF